MTIPVARSRVKSLTAGGGPDELTKDEDLPPTFARPDPSIFQADPLRKDSVVTYFLQQEQDEPSPYKKAPARILFSDRIKNQDEKEGEQQHYSPAVEIFYKFDAPDTQSIPIHDTSQRPGFVPLSTAFHMQSNRERAGDDDDGLDEGDLSAVDGVARRPVSGKKVKKLDDNNRRLSQQHSFIYEAIHMVKGDFTFPHRTYRPKVQIPFRVPPGHLPQAVVIERLHRYYKKADIGGLCKGLGITPFDLQAVPHYGESSERFYQEMQWRNRVRVNGVSKQEYIRTHFENESLFDSGSDGTRHSMAPGSSKNKKESEGEGYASQTRDDSEYQGEMEKNDYSTLLASSADLDHGQHPFGAMFPLDYFDNEDFDIRPGEEWMFLGWDWKEQKMYPIPAKAYLPMPKDKNNHHEKRSNKCGKNAEDEQLAISEKTASNLLTKTERLEQFRRWLLTERYKRLSKQDDKKAPAPPQNDKELVAFARITTTVPNLTGLIDEVVQDDEEVDGNNSPGHDQDIYSTTSFMSIRKLFSGEVQGEMLGDSYSDFDVGQGTSDFLSQFKKSDGGNEEEEEGARSKNELKRSESLLPEVFSDPDSVVASPDESTATMAGTARDNENGGEDMVEDYQNQKFEARGSTSSEGGMHMPKVPNSPDIDPYEDGYEDLVFDYDKMKKVHNYDWKWVDVAVFKFDQGTRRYFVRTISAPYVFAWIGKLYLLMDGEDPHRHALRIQDAVVRRRETENIMRYNLYVDCLPMDRAKSISSAFMKSILVKVLDTPKLEYKDKTIKRIQKEIDLEYQRTHLMLEFNYIVEKHPKLYEPWVKIPPPFINWGDGSEWKRMKSWLVDTGSFTYKKAKIQKLSVIYKKEPHDALIEVMALCLQAQDRRLINASMEYSMGLEDFLGFQIENITQVINFLKEEWMEEVLTAIRKHLSKIPSSWYNIKETRWDVYLMSKTCNYLTLVKFIMEDTLRFITENSLEDFVDKVDTYTARCEFENTYDWGEDLIKSEFPPPEGMTPPFMLELTMDKDGPKYTQLLSRFPKMVAFVFERTVKACNQLPDVVPQIMTNLLFGVDRRLQGVEEQEEKIKKLKARLLRSIRKGLYPVDKYAQKYKRYLQIWTLNLHMYFRAFESVSTTAVDLRKAVEAEQAEYDRLEAEIPSQMDIACFRIITDVVKQGLLKKKKSQINGLLDQFALKLKLGVQKIRDEYQEMERKLNTRSDDIQEVMELKLYIETVPGQVQRSSEHMTKLMKDYDIFEKFSYLIPQDDFEAKWNTSVWSARILKIVEEAVTWLDDDYDRLLKVQQSDMSALSDTVDSASLSVAGLGAFVELEKAIDVSQEVRKLWKQVKDLQEQNELLNKRQEIFGLPSTQNEALGRLVRDIEPFKSLWFTAADWLRLQEVVYKETLDKIDIRVVNNLISEGTKVMRRCVRYFKGADAIQHIAEEVQHQLEDFKRIVPLIQTLKNQGMRQRHWEAISDVCGFTVVAKGNQNFKALLDQGIGKHVDAIAEIGILATNEYAIENHMEKMQRQLNNIKITTAVDPVSGVAVIEVMPESQKALGIINDFITSTDELQSNPYKAPFEERLNAWDKKLGLTRDNLNLWLESQGEWINLQPHFSAPDAATKMPPEYKMFTKMERIWRRLNRLVRDTPEILEIGSDSTVHASLLQFSGLVQKVNKGLEEYMRPHGSSSDDDDAATTTTASGGRKRSIASSTHTK